LGLPSVGAYGESHRAGADLKGSRSGGRRRRG
jgi:hypothetical protein